MAKCDICCRAENLGFCPMAKNLEIPTKVNCPLIDFNVR